MKTSDFYFDLPEQLIAQTPVTPRDSSRLLVYQNDKIEHVIFADIINYLNKGDAIVINQTKVIPARLLGVKRNTKTQVEFLLLKKLSAAEWEIIMKPGRKLKPGDYVDFSLTLCARIISKDAEGITKVFFEYEGVFENILDELGQMPLPPYITEKLEDKDRYQTVYAKEQGSAAAPTAGLHFTPELIEKIKAKGVHVLPVLLHVGLGTFRPVKVDDVSSHKMHSEYYSISQETAQSINKVKKEGGKVIAVGTTSVRTLESAADKNGCLKEQSGNTDIFIYPGYKFKCTDAIITNFHLPESTLIMLVSAFIGKEKTLSIYKTAIEQQYRFFSFGDAMLIL